MRPLDDSASPQPAHAPGTLMRRGLRRKAACALFIALTAIAALAAYPSASPGSQDRGRLKSAEPRFMGLRACKKCHQKRSIGTQYNKWKELKHAKTYELLKTDRAQEVASGANLSGRPHELPECLKCHTAAWGHPRNRYGPRYRAREGVACEACHGPGEFYADPLDGKNHTEAVGKGYVKPTEKTCRRCHNETSPTWDPSRYTTKDGEKVGFDFEALLEKIRHAIPR